MTNRLISSIYINNQNASQHFRTDSKLKTFNSIEDHSEIYNEPEHDFDEDFRIKKWKELCQGVHKKYVPLN